jgi:hypothetical protein
MRFAKNLTIASRIRAGTQSFLAFGTFETTGITTDNAPLLEYQTNCNHRIRTSYETLVTRRSLSFQQHKPFEQKKNTQQCYTAKRKMTLA